MGNSIKKAFSCTQNQLYIICFLAWKHFMEQLAAFTNYSEAYTADFGKDAVMAVQAAKKLQNIVERNQMTTESRNKLSAATATFCKNFRDLKLFIKKAFEGAEIQENLTAAGSAYYAKAFNEDWDSLETLIKSASNLIALKQNELMLNRNMPAAFKEKFLKDAALCSSLLLTYKGLAVTKSTLTDDKMTADNAIYETMMSMMESGQSIFSKQKAIKDQFTFAKLYKIAKSQSPASIKGYIRDADGNPLKDAIVKIEKSELVAVTNKGGFFSFNRLSGDNSYMLEITKPDFIDLYEGVILKPGTAKHLNLQLTPVVVEQPVQMHQQNGEATAQAV